MTTIAKSVLVPYSAKQMFELVNDIESYPEFLPWCRSSKILLNQGEDVRAEIELVKGGVHKHFTTRNKITQHKQIEMKLEKGPFKHLQGFWRFESLQEQACRVSLNMEFEFSGKLINMAFAPVFTQIANTLVDSFLKRAKQIYVRK